MTEKRDPADFVGVDDDVQAECREQANFLLARGVRMPGSSDADIPEWAPECLAMIRETLTEIGMDMKGCPPMMYNDAVRNLAVVLGRKAGFATWQEIRAYVSEQQGTIAQPSEP